MALSEVIKYEGDNSTFIWKYPIEDVNCLTELVVEENQEAIFFVKGQVADMFGPGRYELNADNIPILTNLINNETSGKVLRCEVYFITKTVQMDVNWCTSLYHKLVESAVQVHLSGEVRVALLDGGKMLLKLVESMNGYARHGRNFVESLNAALALLIATTVKSNLLEAIKQTNVDIFKLDKHVNEISSALRDKIIPVIEEDGLSITQFYIHEVDILEDREIKMLNILYSKECENRMRRNELEFERLGGQQEVDKKKSLLEDLEKKIKEEIALEKQKRNLLIKEIVILQNTKSSLGLFKRKERKEVQVQIDAKMEQLMSIRREEDIRKGYEKEIEQINRELVLVAGNLLDDIYSKSRILTPDEFFQINKKKIVKAD